MRKKVVFFIIGALVGAILMSCFFILIDKKWVHNNFENKPDLLFDISGDFRKVMRSGDFRKEKNIPDIENSLDL